MKTLYLLRHAKAEAGGKVIGDMDRTLSERGREACKAVGNYLKKNKYNPDYILSSPSARTRETLERVTEAAEHFPRQDFSDRLYLATAEEIIKEIHGLDDNLQSVMLIGHNPGMHNVALLLAKGEDRPKRIELEIKFPTAALAVLDLDIKHWQEVTAHSGELIDFISPQSL